MLKFVFSSKIYPLEVVKLTAAFFSDKAEIDINEKKDKLEIKINHLANGQNPKNLEKDFKKELLFNSIRYLIAQHNAKIREYIVSQALYSSYPSEIEEFLSKTQEDYLEDPLKITVPWEKKVKTKPKKGKK